MATICKVCRTSMERYFSRSEYGHRILVWHCPRCARMIEEMPHPGEGNEYK